jgi:hypothetical protein
MGQYGRVKKLKSVSWRRFAVIDKKLSQFETLEIRELQTKIELCFIATVPFWDIAMHFIGGRVNEKQQSINRQLYNRRVNFYGQQPMAVSGSGATAT